MCSRLCVHGSLTNHFCCSLRYVLLCRYVPVRGASAGHYTYCTHYALLCVLTSPRATAAYYIAPKQRLYRATESVSCVAICVALA